MRKTIPAAFVSIAILFPLVLSACATITTDTPGRAPFVDIGKILFGPKPSVAPAPVDTDKDGVPDNYDNRDVYKMIPPYIDHCPTSTPPGVKVDKFGCPVDSDGDGVPDYLDKCPGTPAGVKVDKGGCPLDSDGDGVPDYLDKCPGTPAGVKVDKNGCPLDSDGDGVPDYLDKCAGTPAGVKVDKDGCPLDSDGDGVPDYFDKCPNTPSGVKVDENGCSLKAQIILMPEPDGTVGQIEISTLVGSQKLDKPWESTEVVSPDVIPKKPVVMDEKEVRSTFKDVLEAQPPPFDIFIVYFRHGKTELTKESLQLIPEIVRTIKWQVSNNVSVIGHTDTIGSIEYNRKLSERRAQSIADLLISRGIDRAIVKIEFYGEEKLLVETPDGKAEPRNRRVEIMVK